MSAISATAPEPAFLPFASLAWFKRQLAPTPERARRTAIMVAAAVLCVIISMTLQVPELSVTAYMPFFMSKESKFLTTVTGVIGLIGLTIGIGASLLLYKFTYGYPELRIPGMAITLFLGMYVSRIFVLGPLGFLIGFVVAVTQSVGEAVPSPELLVRGLLWLWVAIAYGAGLTVVLNLLFLPDSAGPPAHLPKPKSFFVSDAFTNPAHVHFALKVTFAAMFCYIFYMAIDWSGIHTALITCTFISLESTGATLHKGVLRIRRLCDRWSTRALHHRLSHASHGHNRVVDCGGGLCLCHCRLGRHRNRAHLLCGFTDSVRFFLQRFPGLCPRHRSR